MSVRYTEDISEVGSALSDCRLTVTDSNVAKLYPGLAKDAFVIPAGEASKTQETLFDILRAMAERRLDRSDRIAALGGGVVGDLTGLAAALYMRGIDYLSVPTTLLAMVDSGLGGKTAVDFAGVKNLIGAFHQAKQTLIYPRFIDTLPKREILSGCGETVKTCLLKKDAYSELLDRTEMIFAGEKKALLDLIPVCVEIKSEVVARDPKEKGLRRVLNLGHTVGHALEAADGFKLSHGEYVLKGIMSETNMFGEFVEPQFLREVTALCKRFTSPPKSSESAVCETARRDKKNRRGSITVMVAAAPGDVLELCVDEAEFAARYTAAIKTPRGKK